MMLDNSGESGSPWGTPPDRRRRQDIHMSIAPNQQQHAFGIDSPRLKPAGSFGLPPWECSSWRIPPALPVCRSSALPAASFIFCLAIDILAVPLAVPLIQPAKVFHLLCLRPAGRTQKKGEAVPSPFPDSLNFPTRTGSANSA